MSDDFEATIEQLVAEIAKLPKISSVQVRVFTNENVPLQRTNPDTGERQDALFWKIDGAIHVHPDRWKQFVEVMRRSGAELR